MPDRILCYDFGGTGFRVGVADRNMMLAQERRDISNPRSSNFIILDDYD